MPYTLEQERHHRQDLVKALRSGDYDQTTGKLRDEDAYCCLGVACDLSGLGEWAGNDYVVTALMRSWCNLPAEVADYYGFVTRDGDFEMEREREMEREMEYPSLVTLNDAGENFESIAQLIEEEPVGLVQT